MSFAKRMWELIQATGALVRGLVWAYSAPEQRALTKPPTPLDQLKFFLSVTCTNASDLCKPLCVGCTLEPWLMDAECRNRFEDLMTEYVGVYKLFNPNNREDGWLLEIHFTLDKVAQEEWLYNVPLHQRDFVPNGGFRPVMHDHILTHREIARMRWWWNRILSEVEREAYEGLYALVGGDTAKAIAWWNHAKYQKLSGAYTPRESWMARRWYQSLSPGEQEEMREQSFDERNPDIERLWAEAVQTPHDTVSISIANSLETRLGKEQQNDPTT